MANNSLFIRLSPLLFVLIWSTGFIAAKYSMANADPFVFLCLRMALTTLVLIPILYLSGVPLPRKLWQYRHDMMTGFLLHCCYLGFVFWPIKQGMPSGIVAIIIGIQPILTMVLASVYIGESLTAKKIIGLVIGFIGVAIVILGKFGLNLINDEGLGLLPIGMCLLSLLSASTSVIYQKKFCGQSHLLTGTLMQYVAATVATAVFAFAFGESWQVEWSTGFAIALTWQVFGLSIGGVVLLMSIIKLGEASRISSMFYLVPPLVVVEAHYLFGETLSTASIAGMALCVMGVYFVNRPAKIVTN
ncbi:MAG: drug/metabolite transporter (DMT)-like permease [Gammaproteobacteria bacterium]|jgi:drug/metabolite transporter (DMT)-like permease